MKMVKYYVLGALIALALCVASTNTLVSALLAWTGFSLVAVSSAYLLNYPSLFRKRDDGSIPLYIRWIFVPFLLGSWLYNEYARRNDSVPPLQKIEDKLFLACRMSTKHVELLKENEVSAILDVTAEFDGLDWTAYQQDFRYLNIPVLDHTSPSKEQLLLAINWIKQQQNEGKNVVVHCALGRGRSVLVVAAYLLAMNPELTVEASLAKINAIRQTARLNKRQLASLQKIKDGGFLSLGQRLTLIVNPVAGGGKWEQHKGEVLSRLNEKFSVTVLKTTPDIDGKKLATKAVNEGATTIIACGGDGTLTEVAGALINSDITMGVIPFGTANALSQVLHGYRSKVMPVSTACDVIIEGNCALVDTAMCNQNPMLLVAAVGFEEKMISAASRNEKDEGGQFAYLKGLWNAISNNENMTFSIAIDSEVASTLETPSLVIANAAPMTTVLAQGSAPPDITDGKLDLTWLTPHPDADRQFLTLAELAFSPSSAKEHSEMIKHAQGSSITLTFDRTFTYAVDGEIFESDSIHIKSLPKSLRVLSSKIQQEHELDETT